MINEAVSPTITKDAIQHCRGLLGDLVGNLQHCKQVNVTITLEICSTTAIAESRRFDLHTIYDCKGIVTMITIVENYP